MKRLAIRPYLAALVLIIPLGNAVCDPATNSPLQRLDLYTDGQKAYKENDYVTALKDLFAFKLLNERKLQDGASDAAKDATTKLDQAIADSESKLQDIVKSLQTINSTIDRTTIGSLTKDPVESPREWID
jgi:hypothetical protein